MASREMIIVGGGISGLSLAHYCAKAGLRPLVVEKGGRFGGSFHTHRRDGFWFELGAHTCYNSYGNLIDLLDDTGLLDKILKPGKAPYKLLSQGQLRSIFSALSLPELLLSARGLVGAKTENRTVESYYSKIVGKRNFETVVAPLFSAVICQRANDFPADMLFKRRPRRRDIIKKFTLPGGLQTIADTISAEPGIETAHDMEVTKIVFRSGAFTLYTSEGSSFETGRVALATPSPVAARLIRDSFPDVAEKLASIGSEEIETLGVAVKSKSLKLGAVAAVAASDDIFYSFVSRDVLPDPVYRGFAFHFRAGNVSEQMKLDRIRSVLGTGEFEEVVPARHFVPSLRLGHNKIVSEIDNLLAATPLFLTGNYLSGLAIEDCLTRSLQEFRRLTG